jgi:CrcB protein
VLPVIKWLYLIAGSIAGGLLRYLVGHTIDGKLGASFPWGTLAVNTSGCFFMGLFSALAFQRARLGPEERMLLMTGFCGAYTTFSALVLESNALVDGGKFGLAGVNILISLLFGFSFYRLGVFAGQWF